MEKEELMREAIKDAKKNGHHFGAVVARDGKIISKTGKRPSGDPRYHAERQAIIKATDKLNTLDLRGCTLYSTSEPCPMCFYMAWITNISEIVFGSSVKDAIIFGAEEIKISVKELNKKGGNKIKIEGGFLKKECMELFKT